MNKFLKYARLELRYRKSHSILFWMYVLAICILVFVGVLRATYFSISDLNIILSIMIFTSAIFFPLNADIFTREEEMGMKPYLLLGKINYHDIIPYRTLSNALVMILPIYIFHLFATGVCVLNGEINIFIFIFLNLNRLLLLGIWGLIMVNTLFLTLKYSKGFFKNIIIYFIILILGIFSSIVSFLFLDRVKIITDLFVYLFTSTIVVDFILYPSLFIILATLVYSLRKLYFSLLKRVQTPRNLERVDKSTIKKNNSHYLSTNYDSNKQIIVLLGSFLIFTIYIFIRYLLIKIETLEGLKLATDEEKKRVLGRIAKTVFLQYDLLLNLFFPLVLISIMLLIPKLNIEKESQMEEMILTRITPKEYFKKKLGLFASYSAKLVIIPILIIGFLICLENGNLYYLFSLGFIKLIFLQIFKFLYFIS